jgi:chromosome segregation ATPase
MDMKKSLLIVGLLVIGTQLQAMMPSTLQGIATHKAEIEAEQKAALAAVSEGKKALDTAQTAYNNPQITGRVQIKKAADTVFQAQRAYQEVKLKYASTIERLIALNQMKDFVNDRNRLAELTAQNTGLQKSLEEANKNLNQTVAALEVLNNQTRVEKGSFTQEISHLKQAITRTQSALQLANNEVLKYAQELRAKEQVLARVQAEAKAQEVKLGKENKEILDSATTQGSLSAQQIKTLEANIKALEDALGKTREESSGRLRDRALLKLELAQARPQPSALTRFMNWLRSKKPTAQ